MMAEDVRSKPGGSERQRDGLYRQSSLLRQGFLTLPRTLSRETAKQMFKDRGQPSGGSPEMKVNFHGSSARPQQEQPTSEEMTLQDFLVRAGLMKDPEEPKNQSKTLQEGSLRDFDGLGGIKTENIYSAADEQRFHLAGSELANCQEGCNRNSARIGSYLTQSPASVLSSQSAADSTPSDSYQNVVASEWLNPQQLLLKQKMAAETAGPYDVIKRVITPEASPMVGMKGMRPNNVVGGSVGVDLGDSNFKIGLGAPLCGGMGGLALGSVSPAALNPNGCGYSHLRGFCLPPPSNCRIDGLIQGCKRESEMEVKKVIERRQRRMIKNRESAARSRARKQAYTVELELEVRKLQEENKFFKRQQEEAIDRKRNLVLELMNTPSIWRSSPMPKRLRRTATGPW